MLCRLRKSTPSDLARQPRTLDELKRWKATEFRQFLLITGPLVLKGVVDDEIYFHFLTLSTAMRVFLESNNEVRNHYKNYTANLTKLKIRKKKLKISHFYLVSIVRKKGSILRK
jgi:hypothetical protein